MRLDNLRQQFFCFQLIPEIFPKTKKPVFGVCKSLFSDFYLIHLRKDKGKKNSGHTFLKFHWSLTACDNSLILDNLAVQDLFGISKPSNLLTVRFLQN